MTFTEVCMMMTKESLVEMLDQRLTQVSDLQRKAHALTQVIVDTHAEHSAAYGPVMCPCPACNLVRKGP